MNTAAVLADAFGRIQEVVTSIPRGLTPEQLAMKPYADGNTIAWLLWHLTRIQDDHLAGASGIEQRWTAEGWFERFALPFSVAATGYGHGPDDVAAVRVDAELLVGYHASVSDHTITWVEQLSDADLDRIVDESWDPPVSLGVRLVSVISDDLQHAGQAAYLRGMLLA
ncbi:DUF664 domain-containing protein [Leifsonia bigeumensis]|uniref:DUF664 domain-containing protein n=1 Tax=Leifsonella bigeumensis TaxID=433643 RepID=A0ABP7FMQ5_9MICO